MANLCARTEDLLLEALRAAHDVCWLVAVPHGRDHRAISVCFPRVSSKGWVQTPALGHFKSNQMPRSAVVHLGVPVGSGRGAGQERRAGARGRHGAEAGARAGSAGRARPGYAVLSAPRSAMSAGPPADRAQHALVSLLGRASGEELAVPPCRSCAGVRLSTNPFPHDGLWSEIRNFYQR